MDSRNFVSSEPVLPLDRQPLDSRDGGTIATSSPITTVQDYRRMNSTGSSQTPYGRQRATVQFETSEGGQYVVSFDAPVPRTEDPTTRPHDMSATQATAMATGMSSRRGLPSASGLRSGELNTRRHDLPGNQVARRTPSKRVSFSTTVPTVEEPTTTHHDPSVTQRDSVGITSPGHLPGETHVVQVDSTRNDYETNNNAYGMAELLSALSTLDADLRLRLEESATSQDQQHRESLLPETSFVEKKGLKRNSKTSVFRGLPKPDRTFTGTPFKEPALQLATVGSTRSIQNTSSGIPVLKSSLPATPSARRFSLIRGDTFVVTPKPSGGVPTGSSASLNVTVSGKSKSRIKNGESGSRRRSSVQLKPSLVATADQELMSDVRVAVSQSAANRSKSKQTLRAEESSSSFNYKKPMNLAQPAWKSANSSLFSLKTGLSKPPSGPAATNRSDKTGEFKETKDAVSSESKKSLKENAIKATRSRRSIKGSWNTKKTEATKRASEEEPEGIPPQSQDAQGNDRDQDGETASLPQRVDMYAAEAVTPSPSPVQPPIVAPSSFPSTDTAGRGTSDQESDTQTPSLSRKNSRKKWNKSCKQCQGAQGNVRHENGETASLPQHVDMSAAEAATTSHSPVQPPIVAPSSFPSTDTAGRGNSDQESDTQTPSLTRRNSRKKWNKSWSEESHCITSALHLSQHIDNLLSQLQQQSGHSELLTPILLRHTDSDFPEYRSDNPNLDGALVALRSAEQKVKALLDVKKSMAGESQEHFDWPWNI